MLFIFWVFIWKLNKDPWVLSCESLLLQKRENDLELTMEVTEVEEAEYQGSSHTDPFTSLKKAPRKLDQAHEG